MKSVYQGMTLFSSQMRDLYTTLMRMMRMLRLPLLSSAIKTFRLECIVFA